MENSPDTAGKYLRDMTRILDYATLDMLLLMTSKTKIPSLRGSDLIDLIQGLRLSPNQLNRLDSNNCSLLHRLVSILDDSDTSIKGLILVLLKKGVNISAKDNSGHTAVDLAKQLNKDNLASAIVEVYSGMNNLVANKDDNSINITSEVNLT